MASNASGGNIPIISALAKRVCCQQAKCYNRCKASVSFSVRRSGRPRGESRTASFRAVVWPRGHAGGATRAAARSSIHSSHSRRFPSVLNSVCTDDVFLPCSTKPLFDTGISSALPFPPSLDMAVWRARSGLLVISERALPRLALP